jgi:hypothetical protein
MENQDLINSVKELQNNVEILTKEIQVLKNTKNQDLIEHVKEINPKIELISRTWNFIQKFFDYNCVIGFIFVILAGIMLTISIIISIPLLIYFFRFSDYLLLSHRETLLIYALTIIFVERAYQMQLFSEIYKI